MLPQHAGRTAGHDGDVIYVGLGDQFDDDRRLIRAAVPTSLATWKAIRAATVKPLRKYPTLPAGKNR
jgi:hypothetical protein